VTLEIFQTNHGFRRVGTGCNQPQPVAPVAPKPSLQRHRVAFNGFVILVQRRRQQQDRGDAARGVGDVAAFLQRQAAAQQFVLAVREPLLEHLVSAQRVLPHVRGNVAPEGLAVQIDVVRFFADCAMNLRCTRTAVRTMTRYLNFLTDEI
jgi:hypothetical protein